MDTETRRSQQHERDQDDLGGKAIDLPDIPRAVREAPGGQTRQRVVEGVCRMRPRGDQRDKPEEGVGAIDDEYRFRRFLDVRQEVVRSSFRAIDSGADTARDGREHDHGETRASDELDDGPPKQKYLRGVRDVHNRKPGRRPTACAFKHRLSKIAQAREEEGQSRKKDDERPYRHHDDRAGLIGDFFVPTTLSKEQVQDQTEGKRDKTGLYETKRIMSLLRVEHQSGQGSQKKKAGSDTQPADIHQDGAVLNRQVRAAMHPRPSIPTGDRLQRLGLIHR